MVITTSPSATASAPLPKTCTPLSAAADEAAGTGSKPRTVCPAATRFAAIGPPMLPRPRNAIVVICGSSLSLLHPGGLGAADHHPHDLVGSLENSVHAQVADDLLQSVLSQIAVSAVQLQRLVGDVIARVGDRAFGHRAQFNLVRVVVIEGGCSPPQQHSGRYKRCGHVGESEPDCGLVEQAAAERLPVAHVSGGLVIRSLRATQRARRDVHAPTVEPVHRDPESRPFAVGAAQHRVRGHPDTLEDHLRGRLGVPTHLLLLRAETQPGSALLDDKRRDAAWSVSTGARHDDVDVRYACAGDELLDA